MKKQTGKPPARPGTRDDRAARLAEALRANLKRRKAQDRARKPATPERDGQDG